MYRSIVGFRVVGLACLVLLWATLEAVLHILSQVGGNVLAELLNVLAIDLLGKAKSSIDDVGVESKEALSDLVGTRVLGVESSNKGSLLAVVIELEMDRSLWEYSSLELVQSAGNLGVLSSSDKPVLKDITELEVGAFYKCEKLGSPWVNMRSVDATGLHEAKSSADAKSSKDGEGLDVLEQC